jgi:hypothetical protein
MSLLQRMIWNVELTRLDESFDSNGWRTRIIEKVEER